MWERIVRSIQYLIDWILSFTSWGVPKEQWNEMQLKKMERETSIALAETATLKQKEKKNVAQSVYRKENPSLIDTILKKRGVKNGVKITR